MAKCMQSMCTSKVDGEEDKVMNVSKSISLTAASQERDTDSTTGIVAGVVAVMLAILAVMIVVGILIFLWRKR